MDLSYQPATEVTDDDITNDPFYLDISVAQFIEERRIPAEFSQSHTRSTLVMAMAHVNGELLEWQAEMKASGIDSIRDVPGSEIDGEPQQVAMYRAAVFSYAKAQLLRHFETLNQKEEANNLAKSGHDTYQSMLQESQLALRILLGLSAVSVELI